MPPFDSNDDQQAILLMKHANQRPQSTHPHPWQVSETTWQPDDYALNATLFAQANGLLGVRGTFEEGLSGDEAERGCYLNGVYCREPIRYGESAYGYARHNERIASAPDPFALRLSLDGQAVDLRTGEVSAYQRHLDLRTGEVRRELVWQGSDGTRLQLESRRLVSLAERDMAVLEYRITALDRPVALTLTPELDALPPMPEASDDPRAGSAVDPDDIEALHFSAQARQLALASRIRSSEFRIFSVADHQFSGPDTMALSHDSRPGHVHLSAAFELAAGESLTLTRRVIYAFDRAGSEPAAVRIEQLSERLTTLPGDYQGYLPAQQTVLERFWADSDVEIAGNPHLQQGMRFNLFHLCQSVGRDGFNNIAAKGLTGHGYDGHYFWDTEIYILPFFLYTQPELARDLLRYRYSILDAARARAREMSIERGCLFPWRTIGGEECSAYYPAGTAQYHINADIAHAVKQYHQVTGDDDFMLDYGAEIVLESARMWLCLGHFSAAHEGQFCLDGVTGPDEYTAVVNNNYFTNAMAQAHLRHAAELVGWLQAQAPARASELLGRLQIDSSEVETWQRAADRMYLPRDAATGLHLQDDSFLEKKRWDFEATPADHYPLLLHYHPLVIYRHQVCKQADLVLAMLLLSDQFTRKEKRRNFDYYEAVTTHDSTLSACIHSILAAELGDADKAAAYFEQVARMDLDNNHGNTRHGIHTACMGGTWLCVVQGFAGMRVGTAGQLRFRPQPGAGMSGYRFRLRHQGVLLSVSVEAAQVVYQLPEGGKLTLQHGDEDLVLDGSTPAVRELIQTAA